MSATAGGAGATPGAGWLGRVRGAVQGAVGRYRELGALPDARRLLLAASGSYVGDRLNTIALIALSFELGDGALGVGGMLALFMLPRLLVQGPAGALVDRFPGKGLLVVTLGLMAVGAAAFALLAVAPSLWLLYGLTLVLATLKTVSMPAFEVRLMAATPAEQRGTANALHTVAFTVGDFVGPLLGGLLLAWLGATPLFLLNGLSFVGVALAVARTGGDAKAAAEAAEAEAEAPSAPAGLGYLALLRRPDVGLYAGLTVATSVLIMGTIALFVVRSQELGLGEGGVGLFYAIMGVGTLVGGLAAGAGSYTGPRALLVAAGAAAVGALSQVLFGAAGGVALAFLGLAIFGLTGDLEEIAALTSFQNRLPERVYGRFFSLFLMANGLGGLVGALLGPLLAEAAGAGTALGLMALPALALALLFALREGGLRPRLSAGGFAAMPEPEVVGHGLFGVPSASDVLPDREPGGLTLVPRLSRLI